MANADRPRGLRPAERGARQTPYVADGTIYPGDAVKIENDGKVVAASASNALLGVAVNYAVTGDTVMVLDDPNQKFVVQGDDGTTLAQAGVGLNYNVVATGGSTAYKQSRMELDSSSGATDSTLPLRLLGFQASVGNAAGEFAECIVVINNHQLRPGSEGL
jgi:hypothetical protein